MLYDKTSIMAVFEAIAAGGEISRAEISEQTGFSQVTVGKAVDVLDSCYVITQYKRERPTAGRKTGICMLNNRYGMLLLDFAAGIIRIADLTLKTLYETKLQNSEAAMEEGFSCFAENCVGELMGIGCVVPDGKLHEYASLFPMPPELTIEAGKAAAIANALRFDESGAAVFLQAGEHVCGALMLDGKLYAGAGGRAGDFSRLIPEASALQEGISQICALLDPALIHIACDVPLMINVPEQTELVIEAFSECRSALDGAALCLREKWLRQRIAEHS